MTTQDQKAEHRREAILRGYAKALREHNMVAVTAMREKHSEFLIAFVNIDNQQAKEE